jgi:hypothetical protein
MLNFITLIIVVALILAALSGIALLICAIWNLGFDKNTLYGIFILGFGISISLAIYQIYITK